MKIETQIPTINYQNQPYFLEKRYDIGNSNRILLPEETLKKIKPYFPKIGLTRLGNIAGLDRVGVPVTIAIRPNSYSLSQSSGKSTNLESALVSAAMESLELYCAENINLEIIKASYKESQESFNTIPLDEFEFSKYSLFNRNRPEDWLRGWDIVNQEEFLVPYHSVTLDFRLFNELEYSASFIMSSNGLASGNHFLEAVLAGLYEVIERDSISCHNEANRYGKKKIKIDLAKVANEEIQKLCQQLESKQLLPSVFDCSTDVNVPVFEAYLSDLQSNNITVCHGYGAHLNPYMAMMRALTEAIQARTIIVSGSRDDIFKDTYQAHRIRYQSLLKRIETSEQNEVVEMTYTEPKTQTFNEDILILISKLKQVGINRVIVVDLSPKDLDIAVVRVIVPGLEGYHYYGYNPRKRAKKFLAENCSLSSQLQDQIFSANQHLISHQPAGGIQ